WHLTEDPPPSVFQMLRLQALSAGPGQPSMIFITANKNLHFFKVTIGRSNLKLTRFCVIKLTMVG
uniref:Uncharacterized protein n=1 Tax=Castor canadensis TaxID=51338 RepID=A0A8C0WQ47_CASCN